MHQITISTISDFIKYIDSLPTLPDLWFRGVPNTKHFPVPGIIRFNGMDDEGSLEHDFMISYKSYVNDDNFQPWELYALMQHHGLPTRLLDWSESPLVALFFALTSEPTSKSYRAVWVLNPYALNKKTLGVEKLYCPAVMRMDKFEVDGNEININSYLPPYLKGTGLEDLPELPFAINTTQHIRRVSSQKGCFTVHGSKNDGIHTYLDDPDNFQMIRIDVTSKAAREKMIETLASLGIDEEFIYQDLDALCRKIKRIRMVN